MISEHTAKQRCQWLITAMLGEHWVDAWWSKSNKAFDNKSPADMWTEDYHRVYEYLMSVASK